MSERAGSSEPVAVSLTDEHMLLRREIASRADAVLRETDEGRWPERELATLLDYLQLEALRQIVDEEWLLFRAVHHTPGKLSRLRRDHLELRLSVDHLTQVAGNADAIGPGRLGAAVRDLLTQFDTHLASEEQTFAGADGPPPSTAALGSQPHEWYSLTEGPVIDLDKLPGPQGADAAIDRLLRLRPGERVQLEASTDPGPVWQHLWRNDPAGYGVTYLEQGPGRWRVEITRRPPESGLSPFPG